MLKYLFGLLHTVYTMKVCKEIVNTIGPLVRYINNSFFHKVHKCFSLEIQRQDRKRLKIKRLNRLYFMAYINFYA